MLSQIQKLPPDKRRLALKLLQERADLIRFNRWNSYQPYQKQIEFHHSLARERLFEAGNQLGKTLAGGMEVAYHATGKYPAWWKGVRYSKPVKIWVAGESGESTRDNPQRLLCGDIGEWSSGCIPRDLLGKRSLARGVADLIDHLEVKHEKGLSHVFFKSYGKGREKWQGETVDFIWFDEEPPMDVYSEGLTRTSKNLGSVIVTFTPLKGMSSVVYRFHGEDSPDRKIIQMTIDDVVREKQGHYTSKQAEQIIAGYPEHEREARSKGTPMLGSGRIFPVSEASITIQSDCQIPQYWPKLIGIDFGWGDHPTAAVKAAWDRDSDRVVITDCYNRQEKSDIIAVHAGAIREMGGDVIPVAWPFDGKMGNKSDGVEVKELYRQAGLNMLWEHAQFEDGGYGVEPSIQRLLERMETGRWQVMEHLVDWFEELRTFHRKNGLVVKDRDDLMAASRYMEMMLRYARVIDQTSTKQSGTINYDDRWIV